MAFRRLPVFPLDIVMFPLERLPLHIFEPRYIELVEYCLNEELPFLIVYMNDGKMAMVGCSARIKRIDDRFANGSMNILVIGEERFRIVQLYQDRAFLEAVAEPIRESDDSVDTFIKERAITQHMRLLELAGRTVRPSLYQNVLWVSYVLAPNAGLETDQKQQLLEIPGENERIVFLTEHFETIIPRIQREESFRRKIQSNGHFRDFPPEQKS